MSRHHTLKIIIFALALAVALPAACMAASPVENKRDQAIKFYNARNYKAATELLDDHLLLYPNDIFALYYDGLCYQALGQMERAKLYYVQVLSQAPKHQLGIYAKTILKRVDPGMFAHEKSEASPEMPTVKTVSRPSQSTRDHSIPDEWYVPFTVEGGHNWVDVELNGHKIKMVFDTGAPAVTIGKNQMAEIGLEAPKTPPESSVGGFSSDKLTPCWFVPTRVKVGGVEKTVDMLVMETNESSPLLGQTYAGLFEYTVDASAKRLQFRQRGIDKGDNRNAYTIPYVYQEQGNRIFVDVDINGKVGRCMFDSGNAAAGLSFNNPAQALQYGVSIPHDAVWTKTGGVTGEGRCRRFTLRRVRMGPIDKTDLSVTVSEKNNDDEPPILGVAFWEGYEYTVNRQKKVIEFVRR